MLVSEAITYIRQELNDSLSSRWTTDTQVLRFIVRAVDRAQHVIRKHAPQITIKSASLTVPDTGVVALPTDFLAPLTISKTTGEELTHSPEHEWDRIQNVEVCTFWHIKDGTHVEVKKAPDANTTLTLRYFYDVKPFDLTTASNMPWGGRFNGPIMDYAANRARNVDEMNIQADMQLLQEMELRILDTLLLWSPGVIDGGGWGV